MSTTWCATARGQSCGTASGAEALRQKLVKDTKDFKWQHVGATIEFLDDGEKCVWIIRYEAAVRRGGESGQRYHLNLVVLMDGTIVEPTVSDWPPGD